MASLTFTGTNNSTCKVNGNTVTFPYTLSNGDVIVVKNNSDVDGKFTINGTDYTSNTTLNLQDTDITIVGSEVSGAPVADITITINYTDTSASIIKAGTYTFKENPQLNIDDDTDDSGLVGKMNTLSDNNTYGEMITLSGIYVVKGETLGIYSNSGNETLYENGIWRFEDHENLETFTADDTFKLRTIIIESDVTVSQIFYNWFNSNIETTARKSVDLTTLSGWANLADGIHQITIKAKADGYRDSEKSAGVSVTKPSSGYADCLTFTGESSEFTLKATSKEWDGTLQWSTDHNAWTTLAGTEAMQSVGKKLYLRGKGNTNFKSFHGVMWQLSAKAGCSGNIQTLLDWENPPTSIPSDNCYYSMFEDCANLTTAPDLPATTLTKYCYQYMFKNCVNLTTAPELPATTLAERCYDSMFWYCSRLQVVPELPATTLARYCYDGMFQGCNSLRISTTHGTKIFTAIQYSTAYVSMFALTGGDFDTDVVAGTTYYYYIQNATTVRQVPIVKSKSSGEDISALENMDTTKIYTIFGNENVVTGHIYYKNGSWICTGSLSINEKSATNVKFSYGFGYFYKWMDGAALECDIKATTYDYVNIGASVSNSLASWLCFKQGTLITLADSTTKKVEDVTYDDDLLVWNFYEGKFDSAKPMWIKKPEIADEYNLCKFSNGVKVGFIGQGGSQGYHRIYNDEAKCFTHTGADDTPIGTTTFAEDSTMPKLVSQEVVKEKVIFYNIITDKHYNLFANGILTSCRLSNKYKIENMRYVGECLISEQEEKEYFDECEKIRSTIL